MEGLGLPGDRIHVTGIPVGPEFMTPVDRGEVLRRYDLDPTQPTLLVAGGALGLSPASAVVRRLLQLDRKFQAIIGFIIDRTVTRNSATVFASWATRGRCRIFWAQPLFCSASLAA